MSVDAASIRKLVLWPAVVTLGITLLRLTGELLHWSPSLFNPAAGGGGALVGITWLPPLFGILFAIQLARAGHGPRSGGRAIGMAVLGVVVVVCIMAGAGALGIIQQGKFSMLALILLTSAIAIGAAIAWSGWPDLGRTLLAYAFAARHTRRDRHAGRDDGQLGDALRRGASRVPGNGCARQVVHDRRAAAAHHVDRLHRAAGRAVRVDRGGGGLAPSITGEASRGLTDGYPQVIPGQAPGTMPPEPDWGDRARPPGTQPRVESLRLIHGRQRVQEDALVAGLASPGDDALHQGTAATGSPKPIPDKRRFISQAPPRHW